MTGVGNRYKRSQGEKVEEETPVDSNSLRETGAIIQSLRDGFDMRPALPVDETERILGSRTAKSSTGQESNPPQTTETVPQSGATDSPNAPNAPKIANIKYASSPVNRRVGFDCGLDGSADDD